MIYEIEISVQADSDLRNIYEYIAFELQSPENAVGQLDRLEESILGLNQMPERFREYENEPWHSRGLRSICKKKLPYAAIHSLQAALVKISFHT